MKRLDRVLVSTDSRGTVEISWDTREKLLQRLHGLRGDDAAREFEAAGTSRPVRLDEAGKTVLLEAVLDWMATVDYDQLPEGIRELRDGLEGDFTPAD